jgi:hypothetical protein
MARGPRDFSGFSDAEAENWLNLAESDNFQTSGMGNGPLREPVPHFRRGINTGCEKVVRGRNNTWIVLGRDRPNDVMSGYGGKGNTQAGAIDIVVGRMGNLEEGPKGGIYSSPNFFGDAARIYISQKADIDDYFKLVGDTQLEGTSGIGIKADGVRIIGRRGVKIVSGLGKNPQPAGGGPERDSLGRELSSQSGIELIGANDVDANPLEPLVKAGALAETLKVLVEQILELRGIVDTIAACQVSVNTALQTHVHTVGPATSGTPVAAGALLAVQNARLNDQAISKLYNLGIKMGSTFVTNRLEVYGDKWFGSQFNKTN